MTAQVNEELKYRAAAAAAGDVVYTPLAGEAQPVVQGSYVAPPEKAAMDDRA